MFYNVASRNEKLYRHHFCWYKIRSGVLKGTFLRVQIVALNNDDVIVRLLDDIYREDGDTISVKREHLYRFEVVM